MADSECIYSYSREQAIADGVLVDVSEVAREAGFKVPVALTQALYEGIITPTADEEDLGQSVDGRLWDALFLLRTAAISGGDQGSIVTYPMAVYRGQPPRHEDVTLKAVIGPGDSAEPVITIMLPNED